MTHLIHNSLKGKIKQVRINSFEIKYNLQLNALDKVFTDYKYN